MSYRCDNCDKVHYGSELARESEIRNVNYNQSFLRFDRKENKKVPTYNQTFKGFECVKVDKLCEECYKKLSDVPPRISKEVKDVQFIGLRKQNKEEDTGFDKTKIFEKRR
jgi:hypothetical protein